MNTGLGDAVNLAWKLAMVLEGRADDRLLDTYEPERIAFARRLVSTTDRAFTFVTKDGPIARVVREDVVPRVIPELLKVDAARRYLFRTLSQIMIEYRDSALSAGKAGDVHGGDRLPWTGNNFAPLTSMAWQAHVYGRPSESLAEATRALGPAAPRVSRWRRGCGTACRRPAPGASGRLPGAGRSLARCEHAAHLFRRTWIAHVIMRDTPTRHAHRARPSARSGTDFAIDARPGRRGPPFRGDS